MITKSINLKVYSVTVPSQNSISLSLIKEKKCVQFPKIICIIYTYSYTLYVLKFCKRNITIIFMYYIGFVLYYDVLLNNFLNFSIYYVMKIQSIMDIF